MKSNNFYISSVSITDYKSIQEVEVELDDSLAIIIGPNGAGKSNFLEVLNHIGYNQILFPRGLNNVPRNLSYSVTFKRNSKEKVKEVILSISPTTNLKDKNNEFLSFNVTVIMKSEGEDNKELTFNTSNEEDTQTKLIEIRKEVRPLLNNFVRFIKYNFDYNSVFLSKPQSYIFNKRNETIDAKEKIDGSLFLLRYLNLRYQFSMDDEITDIITSEGTVDENLIIENKIREILLTEFNDTINESVREDFATYSPIKDIRLSKNINVNLNEDNIIISNIIMEFNVNDDWVPWDWLSDGTKRLFYIISEVSLTYGGIILIEEPELGIHPHQLHILMDYIKSKSTNNQFIISTHSPQVLNCLKPNELEKIIISKMSQNGSTFRHLNEVEIKKANVYMKEVGYLSQYWLHSTLEDEND
ncbi:MAG TPA: AAA family ATPase [Ignavibacteria bacterium]|nr:AAA family ATPase [Ignavibacteria bacterium]HMQ98018.1 AAA family ATPase [Ignavibacteria bacterium]